MFYQGCTVNETEEFRKPFYEISSRPFDSVLSTNIICYRGKKDLTKQDMRRVFMDEDRCKFKIQFLLRANMICGYLSNVLHFVLCRGGHFTRQIGSQTFTSYFNGLLQGRFRCDIFFRSHWTQGLYFMDGGCKPSFHSSHGAPSIISYRLLQGVEKRWDLPCFCQHRLSNFISFWYSGVRLEWFMTRMNLSFVMSEPRQL